MSFQTNPGWITFPDPNTQFSEQPMTNALVTLLTAIRVMLLQEFILGIQE